MSAVGKKAIEEKACLLQSRFLGCLATLHCFFGGALSDLPKNYSEMKTERGQVDLDLVIPYLT